MRKLSLLFISIQIWNGNLLALDLPEWKEISLNKYLENPNKSLEIKELPSSEVEGKAKFYILREMNTSGKAKLVMQLIDFDGDKNIDLAKHFENSKLVRSEWSLDKDDIVDSVKYYDENSGDLLLKMENLSGKLMWSHYFKGELRQKEVDRNSDKKADIWYNYKAGKLIKVEAAKNFDTKKIEDITNTLGL